MTILYKNDKNVIRQRTFYEQKNEPTFLNGDKYGNSYHKTCTNTLVLYILPKFLLCLVLKKL